MDLVPLRSYREKVQNLLVLGATSTVAADVIRIYARRGFSLFLLGRSPIKLERLSEEFGSSVHFSQAVDFTDETATQLALQAAWEQAGHVDLVLIAHGYLGDQLLSERDLSEAKRQIDVNFTSVVAQLLVVAPRLEAQGAGHLTVIGSVAGERGRPRNYTYGAAKGALRLYLQGLRSCLWPRIHVTTIKLGPVMTPMSAGHKRNATFITSQQAARGIAHAIDWKRGEVYVPRLYGPIMAAVRVMPERLFQRLKFLSSR